MKKNKVKVRIESPGKWVIQYAVGYSGNSLLRRRYLKKHLQKIERQMDVSENTRKCHVCGFQSVRVLCEAFRTTENRVIGKESEKRVGEMRRGLSLGGNILRPGRLFQTLAFTLMVMRSQ